MCSGETFLYLESVGASQSLAQGPLRPRSANLLSKPSDYIDINDDVFDRQSALPMGPDSDEADTSVEPLTIVPANSGGPTVNPPPRGAKRQDAANGYVVRDTFSMPTQDYSVIEVIRIRLAREGYICSKSEVIRAGLLALNSMPGGELVERISVVEKIKMGRKT